MDLSSQTTFLSVAALGLAVCAGIYVLWGPDNWFRKRGHKFFKIMLQTSFKKIICVMYALTLAGRCPGLANLGNTCFLNAILQVLYSCSNISIVDPIFNRFHLLLQGFSQPPCSEAVAEGYSSTAQWPTGAGTVCYTFWYTL
jgi:hypothetical protein